MTKKQQNLLLAGILLLASILRLIHANLIPFTYDEVTAIIRTHYSTLSEEIKQGVMLHDNHPAGVQLFIYYWTKLFGYNELTVKLPFIAFGILAVYYTYKVGKSWFNPTVGFVCAAYVATLQYPIMYSQEIRPYISGLLVAIAMVYYWTNVVFKSEEYPVRNLILYILFSALCAYDHHFCLLFAAMVGVTGVFFVKGKHLIKYAIAGVLIFVLYIPHLHIFFYQLHRGGVGGPDGWLGAPRNTFIWDYIKYIFQFSRSVMVMVLALIALGIFSTFSKGFSHKKYFFISLVWFLVPLLAGFFYSVYVNPVLQYSVLIFSFPFLLLCLFCWLPDMHIAPVIIAVAAVCTVNTHSLVKARKHYSLFYQAPYERSIVINDSLIETYGKENYGCIIQSDDSDKNVSYYYIRKHEADSSFYFTDNLGCFINRPGNYCNLITLVSKQNKTFFGFGSTAQCDPIVLHIITGYYPYLVKRFDYAGGTFYLLSKQYVEGMPALYSYQTTNTFENEVPGWDKTDKAFLCDSIYFSPHHSYKMDSLHEWAPDFGTPLYNLITNKNDIIEVSLEVYPLEKLEDVLLVTSLEMGGKTIEWRATPVTRFMPDTLRNKWVKAYHTLKLQDLKTNYPRMDLRVYLWNKGKKNFYMDDFSVKVVKGNPVIYGLFEKI